VFTLSTFESKHMNWTAVGEFVVAVLTTQMDALRRILGTTDLNMRQFRWALIPPIAVLGLWELGKFIGRRRAEVDRVASATTRS
jgi:Ca2+-transporting ATPase